jgi:hypothetical protein
VKIKHYTIHCATDGQWEDWYLPEGDAVPTTCPVDTGHTITADSVALDPVILGPDDVVVTNAPNVHTTKPDGMTHGRVYGFSVNFCDKTTWYHDAPEVADEAVGTGDGVQTIWTLAHGTNADANERIIDLSHGKVSEENNIANPAGTFREMANGYGATLSATLSGYVPVVKVNGVELTERPYGDASGGDYTIDYVVGEITFTVAPPDTHTITATYYYAAATDVACSIVVPGAGKKHHIDRVEIQSTPDACPMTDIVMNVYAGAAPPNGQPIARPTIIKNVTDIVNWAYGARPQIPVQGGANPRALTAAVNIHQVRYASSISLLSSMAMYVQVHLSGPVEFAGTWASIVIYGIEEAE